MVDFCRECERWVSKTFYCGNCYHEKYCSKKCQIKSWPIHKRSCFHIDKDLFKNKNNKVFHDALELNLFAEFQAIKNMISDDSSNYSLGRYYLYKGLVGMIMYDPINGDMKENMTDDDEKLWETLNGDVRLGGEYLNKDSPDSMRDSLAWAFIPRRLRPVVSSKWHGVGNWLH